MQTHPGACCPEKLRSLQEIFDAVWMGLESKHSKHTFPWDAQSAHFWIASYLLDHVNDRNLGVNQIKRVILQGWEKTAEPKKTRLEADAHFLSL